MVQTKQPAIDLSLNAAHLSLTDHVIMKGNEIFEKYGPKIGWSELQKIIVDKECVRYPLDIVFDSVALENDEIAYPSAKGDLPEDGFTLYIHPYFSLDPTRIPALGIDIEAYYAQLCEIADEISTKHFVDEPVLPEVAHQGCSSGGSCGCSH